MKKNRDAKITHEERWRRHILQWPDGRVNHVDDIIWDTSEFPGNVSEYHFKRQVILADMLSKLGYRDISLEHDARYDNLRYDVIGISPNGKQTVCEVGELNTRSDRIVKRLKKTYEDGELMLWWHNNGLNMPLKYVDTLRGEQMFTCDVCSGMASPISYFEWQVENDPNWITQINLLHMFEPQAWHDWVDGHFGNNDRRNSQQVDFSEYET